MRLVALALVLCVGCDGNRRAKTVAIDVPPRTPAIAPVSPPDASIADAAVVVSCDPDRALVIEALTAWADAQSDTEIGEPRVVTGCDGGLAAGHAEALFIQRWRSKGRAQHGVKHVRLERPDPNGAYRITHEQVLTTSVGWEEKPRRVPKTDARVVALKTKIRRASALKPKVVTREWDPDYNADRDVPQGSTAVANAGELQSVIARFGSEHSGEIWMFWFAGEQLVYADREEWSWSFADCADGRVEPPCTRETSNHAELFLQDGRVIHVALSYKPDSQELETLAGVTGDTLALCAHWWRLFATGNRSFATHFAQGSAACVE